MAEAVARTRCYDIFSISKVLAVSTEEELCTGPKPADKPVTINAVASGGNEREKFLAVFLSNDFLLFHYYSQISEPLMRMMPWFSGKQKKITTMVFSPSGYWLAAVSADSCLYLIPVAALMQVGTPFGAFAHKLLNPLSHVALAHTPWLRHNLVSGATTIPSLAATVALACIQTPEVYQASVTSHGLGSDINVTYASAPTMPLDDITEFATLNQVHLSAISSCVWWESECGQSFVVVASFDGVVSFTNIRTQSKVVCRFRAAVSKIELIVNVARHWKMLFIHTLDDPYFKLLIERLDPITGALQLYPQFVGLGPFLPQTFRRFLPGTELAVYYLRQGPVIGVFDPTLNNLEMYDVDLDSESSLAFPLFEFRLNPAKLHYFTERFIFSVHSNNHQPAIHVVSNLLASKMATHRRETKVRTSVPTAAPTLTRNGSLRSVSMLRTNATNQIRRPVTMATSPIITKTARISSGGGGIDEFAGAVMQILPLDRQVVSSAWSSVFPAEILGFLPVCPHHRHEFSAAGTATAVCIEWWARSNLYVLGIEGGQRSTMNELFYIWTSGAIFECRRSPTAPANLFHELIASGLEHSDAEPLGKTLGLDLHSLYEEAGDRAFALNEHDRALVLYRLSNARISKLIHKYIAVGRIDVAIDMLRASLLNAPRLKYRSSLVDILLGCLLQQLELSYELPSTAVLELDAKAAVARVCHGDRGEQYAQLHDELCDFIDTNAEFITVSTASPRLLAGSHVDLLMRLAHVRNEMPMCLEAVAKYGALRLTSDDVGFLCSRGYSGILLSSQEGQQLFATLPPYQQLEVVLLDIIPVAHSDRNSGENYAINRTTSPPPTINLDPVIIVSEEEALVDDVPVIVPASSKATKNTVEQPGEFISDKQCDNSNGSVCGSSVHHAYFLARVLESLDAESLVRLARFLDPQHGLAVQLGLVYFVDPSIKASAECGIYHLDGEPAPLIRATASSAFELVEIYLRTLLRLQFVRRQSSTTEPDNRKRSSCELPQMYPPSSVCEALRLLHGQYLSQRMLWICRAEGNYAAASTLFELQGCFSGVFECYLLDADQHIAERSGFETGSLSNFNIYVERDSATAKSTLGDSRNNLKESHPRVSHLVESPPIQSSFCDGILEKCMKLWPLVAVYAEQVRLIGLLCNFWSRNHLPVAQLEAHFCLADLAVPLSFYLFNDAALVSPFVSDSPDSPMVGGLSLNHDRFTAKARLCFSPKLHLFVTRKILELIRVNQLTGKVDRDRLLEQIVSNLNRDPNKRASIRFPPISIALQKSSILVRPPSAVSMFVSGASLVRSEEETSSSAFVAFTCGHLFAHASFAKSFLPELRQRLNRLPLPLPITAKFICDDYLQSQISNSCPLCLYNSLLAEQLTQLQLQPAHHHHFVKWES